MGQSVKQKPPQSVRWIQMSPRCLDFLVHEVFCLSGVTRQCRRIGTLSAIGIAWTVRYHTPCTPSQDQDCSCSHTLEEEVPDTEEARSAKL